MLHYCGTMEFPMRINKYLAHSGVASRREADVLITQKKILINGKVAEMGQQVQKNDKVEVVGETAPKNYFAYYKGVGIVTHSPAAGEVDISGRLKRGFGLTGVAPIGRLEKDSEGLIILSDDGRITGSLLDPDAEHEREYDVTVDKRVSGMFLRVIASGVDIEGYRTKPAKVLPHASNDKRFTIILTEGKKHQLHRMCAALGYQVQSLKRTRVINITLGKLKPNQFRKIAGPELKTFLTELGVGA